MTKVACAALLASVFAPRPAVSRQPTRPAPGPVVSARPRGTLAWALCPVSRYAVRPTAHLECATLSVPLDRGAPQGRSITLALNRLRAVDNRTRLGILIVNPGSPGESGTDLAESYADRRDLESSLPTFTRRFDVIGFDPRGVGKSTPILCGRTRAEVGLNPFDDIGKPEVRADLLMKWKASCRTKSGDLLDHVGTIETAQDMDSIRVALGETSISFLGFSYGTLLGAEYETLFPTRVRAMVLDAAIDPLAYGVRRLVDDAQQAEGRLNSFLAECAASSSCVFNNGSDPHERLDGLLAKLDANPLPAIPTQGFGSVNGRTVRSFLLTSLDAVDQWSAAAQALRDLESGTRVASLSRFNEDDDGYIADQLPEADMTAVNCRDGALPTSTDEVRLARQAIAKVAPRLQSVLSEGADICVGWPVSARPVPSVRAAPKLATLVIGSTEDPVTPYAWSVALVRELGNAVLLTRHGEGHTSADRDRCVNDVVTAYLEALRVPGAGATC